MNAIELAKITGLHKNTVYKLIKEGFIKATKQGKSYEVDDEEAARFIKTRIPFVKENVNFYSYQIVKQELKERQIELITQIALVCKSLPEKLYLEVEKFKDDLENEELANKIYEFKENKSFIKLQELMKEFNNNSCIIQKLETFNNDSENVSSLSLYKSIIKNLMEE